jgi:hypothetical protein
VSLFSDWLRAVDLIREILSRIPKSDLKETGWPTVTLKDVEANSLTWFDLNNKTEPELLVNPYKVRNEFWDAAYRQYGIGRQDVTTPKNKEAAEAELIIANNK